MAERKTGPVKPPTIDLTARERDKDANKTPESEKPAAETAAKPTADVAKTGAATGAKPEAGKEAPDKPEAPKPDTKAPETKPSETEKPETPVPAARRASALPAILAGTVLGGALGLGAAYGLAWYGYWPVKDNSAQIAALTEEVHSLYVKRSDIGDVVDRAVGEVKTEITALDSRIAALESAKPTVSTAEVTALDTKVGTLESQVGALDTGLKSLSDKLDAATIAGGDANATAAVTKLSGEITDLTTRLKALEGKTAVSPEAVAALTGSVKTLEDKIGQLSTDLSALQPVAGEVKTLKSDVTALQSVPAPKPVDLRLPLALSGLGEALNTGAPFATDLDLIHAALPDLAIPANVADAARAGLGSPSDLGARFEARVPDILAARPVAAGGDWFAQLTERLKALVALRPVATSTATTPDALVSRIEAALSAHDFTAAAQDFAALPEPMQAEAGALGGEIRNFAATVMLMNEARAAALKAAGAGS